MFVFMLVMAIVVFSLLLLVSAMQPPVTTLSVYELQRRSDGGDSSATHALNLRQVRRDITVILRIVRRLLLVVASFLFIAVAGWIGGIALIIAMVLAYDSIARARLIHGSTKRLYRFIEPTLMKLVESVQGFIKIVQTPEPRTIHSLGSPEELQHIIDTSGSIFSEDEKKLLIHNLQFNNKVVGNIMTPVDEIISIKKTEFLGPLALDELHKKGHSRLPVIGEDIDHIVGILHLENFLALDIKRSVTAEKAMDNHVYYCRYDHSLPEVLSALLRTHQHLFVVIDESQATRGIVTIDDVVEALIGRKMTNEFDAHDDIRAVAAHKSAEYN